MGVYCCVLLGEGSFIRIVVVLVGCLLFSVVVVSSLPSRITFFVSCIFVDLFLCDGVCYLFAEVIFMEVV